VNVPDLLSELRNRGVTLEAQGDRLRFHPSAAVPRELIEDLRNHKSILLEELRSEAKSCPELDLATAPVAEIRKIRAQLRPKLILYTGYGEVWLTLSEKMAAEVAENERHRDAPRPVLLIDDLADLRTKSTAMIQLILNVLKVFPGSRVDPVTRLQPRELESSKPRGLGGRGRP
jgi:hypothetical protein